MHRLLVPLFLLLSTAAGCAPKQPPRWAEGGATLALGRARWERPSDTTVDLLPDGRVLVDGDHLWTIDTAGRVFLPGNDPVAVLGEDGLLIGPDDERLGTVGVDYALPPLEPSAWLRLQPDGQVLRARPGDAGAFPAGKWHGCAGPVQRTCTLVTQLLAVQEQRSRPRVGVGVGFGIGFGFGGRR